MRVLAIVPSLYDISPGQRFRIEQWEPILKENGVEISYAPFENEQLREVLYKSGNVGTKMSAIARRLRDRSKELKNVGDFDLVYVFREAAILGPAWFEKKIARSGTPMVFDFDDAVFIPYKSPSNGYLSYLKFPGKTASICASSAHVMAGNRYLADYALKVNKNVTVVPTTIDTDRYIPLNGNKVEADVPVIGWSGSHSTKQHLDTIRGMLQELAKMEKFKLRAIGVPGYELNGVDVDAVKWRSESEVEDLHPIDIGLMPLPDDQWTKGKCGLKALQYMALGIPTIVSPVGVNSTIIKDGENGFIADGPEEWIEKIKRLIDSKELREKIGAAGRETVEERYSAKVQAPEVLKIFKSVTKA